MWRKLSEVVVVWWSSDGCYLGDDKDVKSMSPVSNDDDMTGM